jgi:hypothetical protein
MKLQLMWLRAVLLLAVVWACPRQAAGYYDPGAQRWIARDPLEEEGGANLFRFVGNVPVAWIDPDGEQISIPYPVVIKIPAIPWPLVIVVTIVATICETAEAECEAEWRDARQRCAEELANPNPPSIYRPRGAGPGWGVEDCARGLVSERCGGNSLDWGKRKYPGGGTRW